jgi:hypothetical protein
MAVRRIVDSELQRLEAAMELYATKARVIPSVAAVVIVPGEERDLSTFIDERDEDVMNRLMDVEDELFAQFNDELFDFHVWYLDGRQLDKELPRNSRVIYRRDNS